MIEMHGDAGQAWLDELPSRVAGYEHRWAIQVAPPFANLSYNYVAPAVRSDGAQLILKLGMPHPELSSEIAALRHYDGHGSARLTEADPESGAFASSGAFCLATCCLTSPMTTRPRGLRRR